MIPVLATIPSASAVSLTTATPANITSTVLSPGNWLVWANLDATLTGATLTALAASLSLTSATLAAQSGQNDGNGNRLYPEALAQIRANLTTVTGTQTLDVGPTVLQVPPGQNPTLYLVAQATFSAGSVGAYGSVFAYKLPE